MVSIIPGGSACCECGETPSPPIVTGEIAYIETIALLRLAQPAASGDSVVLVGGYYAQGDGGGGLYFWNGSSVAADNGGTVINKTGNVSSGRWILENYGQPISIKQFGAKMDGVTDDTALIQAGLNVVDDLFVPSGVSFVSGTLFMLRDGQKFHGVAPAGDQSGSMLLFGAGTADCIDIGDATIPNAPTGAQLYDMNIDATLRVGTPGFPNPGNATPHWQTTACAIAVLNGIRPRLDRLNIVAAWNGLLNFCSTFLTYSDIAFNNGQGDFCELHYGVPGDLAIGMVARNISHSALADVSHFTSAGVSVGSIIPMNSTAGVQLGWAVRGGGASFADGAVVQAINPGVSVTIGANIVALLPAGTALTFQNLTNGLWIDNYCSSYDGQAIRNSVVANALLTADKAATGTSMPTSIRIEGLNGAGMGRADKVSIYAGRDINLIEPHIVGTVGSTQGGHGLVVLAPAAGVRVLGGEFVFNALSGVNIQGGEVQLIGTVIADNGQNADNVSNGVTVAATASAVQLLDCRIGNLNGAGGQQRFGVNNQGVPAADILINGCDMRRNDSGAVNDPTLFTLGTNVGLSQGGLLNQATQYVLSQMTPKTNVQALAMDTLITSLIAAGVWSITDLFYMFAAPDVNSALINWKLPGSGVENPQAVRNGTAPLTVNRGFTGDGSSGYIDFGVTPAGMANFQLNSGAAFVWSQTNVSNDNATDLGVSGTNLLDINGRNAAGNLVTGANSVPVGTDAVSDSIGLYGFTRNNGSAYVTYKNGSALSTQNIASTSQATANIWALRGFSGFSSRRISVVWMGGGLISTQITALYAAVNAYLTALP